MLAVPVYKSECKEGENLPTADYILALYKKVFGAGRENMLIRLSDQEKKDIVWFCSSVVTAQVGKVGGKKVKRTSYRERVTHSDEAFALMALEFHQQKWTAGDLPSDEGAVNDEGANNTEEQPPKKKRKRVSGAGNSASKKYYTDKAKELRDFREKKNDKYPVAEAWLEKELRAMAGTVDASEADTLEASVEAEDDECADIAWEVGVNPAWTTEV